MTQISSERQAVRTVVRNKMAKALIAMSGGVDSGVAAYLTLQAGYDCIGCTMRLYDNEDAAVSPEKTCCSLDLSLIHI